MRVHLDFANLIMPIIKQERDASKICGQALYKIKTDGYQAVVSQVSLGEALAVLMEHQQENSRGSGGIRSKLENFHTFNTQLDELKPELPPLQKEVLECYNSFLREKDNRLGTVDLLIVAHYACDVVEECSRNNNPQIMLVTDDQSIVQNGRLKDAVKVYWESKGISGVKVTFREPGDL